MNITTSLRDESGICFAWWHGSPDQPLGRRDYISGRISQYRGSLTSRGKDTRAKRSSDSPVLWWVGLAGRELTGELTLDVSLDEAHVLRIDAASSRSNSLSVLFLCSASWVDDDPAAGDGEAVATPPLSITCAQLSTRPSCAVQSSAS